MQITKSLFTAMSPKPSPRSEERRTQTSSAEPLKTYYEYQKALLSAQVEQEKQRRSDLKAVGSFASSILFPVFIGTGIGGAILYVGDILKKFLL